MYFNLINSGILLMLFYCTKYVESWSFDFKLPKISSYNPYCYLKECCNEDWIKFNKNRLFTNLTYRVYGQPLLETAVDALSAHLNPNFPPRKALTLSFHGMTGTGKNYVSNFIAESLFKEGTKSKFVHHFIGRMHFSRNDKVNQYQVDLYNWLKGNMTACNRQLFIFDEVDKMIPEVLNSIKPVIDYRDDVDGVDYSKSIFIFLSNTGASLINEHYHELYIQEGKNREDLRLIDFETLIQKGAFNEQGGFHHSDTITSNLIDHYIPFLPLEEKHIVLCIKDSFRRRNVHSPKQIHVEDVLKSVEWGPDDSKSFSKTGCKRLDQKVALLADKHYPHLTYSREEL